jgi:hypothetical protein
MGVLGPPGPILLATGTILDAFFGGDGYTPGSSLNRDWTGHRLMATTADELVDLADQLERVARAHPAGSIVASTIRECTSHVRAVARLHVFNELVSAATKGQETGSGRIL